MKNNMVSSSNKPLDKLQHLQDLFISNNHTLSIAESCTGGLLSSWITSLPNSSQYFKGGVISYATEIKIKVLKVDPLIIKKHGVVSEEVALLMAQGVKNL